MMAYWAGNPYWRNLDGASKAAAMALLEADMAGGKISMDSAKNALGAMINRAARDNVDIGDHVSGRIYQPTIEDNQFARLPKLVGSPEHQELVKLYNERIAGRTGDWVNGATHFLAPESTMLSLEAGDPSKYRSWRDWTGFDAKTGQYKGVILRDGSHAFLAPEGAYSADFGGNLADAGFRVADASAAGARVAGGPAMVPGLDAAAAFSPAAAQPETINPAYASASAGGGLLGDVSQLGTFNSANGTLTDAIGFGGGLLAFGDTLSKAQDQQQRQDPAQDDQQTNPAEPAPRRPVDLRRVLAILQSRSRLGTA